MTLQKVRLGPDHPDTLGTMNKLAASYQDAGKLDLALTLPDETLTRTKRKFGADNPDTLGSMGNLALGYRAAGKLERALPLLVEAASLWKQKAGINLPATRTPWVSSAWFSSNPGCGCSPNPPSGNA